MHLNDIKRDPTEMPREELLELISEMQASRLISKKRAKKKGSSTPGKLHIYKELLDGKEIAWCKKSREEGKRKPRIKRVSKFEPDDTFELCKGCVKAVQKEHPDSLTHILEEE